MTPPNSPSTEPADVAPLAQSDELSRRLHLLGCVVLALTLGYFLVYAKVPDALNRAQGLVMLVFAAWPSLQWAKSAARRFPLVEVLMLTTANSYALPLLGGEQTRDFLPETITQAAWVVLTFQLSVLVAYRTIGGNPRRGRFWTDEFLGDNACRYLNYGMTINTVFLVVSTFFDVIPREFLSIVRAACTGIGIICAFITARLLGAGQLSVGEKTFFAVNLILQALLQALSLFLLGVISSLALALVGYVTTSRRIPLIACAAVLGLVAVLHNGKPAMRSMYWDADSGFKRMPSLEEIPSFFGQWISFGIDPPGEEDDVAMATKLLQRTSLFQMVCLVTERSPQHEPFLDGESYNTVIAQFVPRFLWPDKPSGLASTSMLAIYYGLQDEEGAQKTSIAFGQVAEAYANFGFFGALFLGGFFGLFYKKAQVWTAHSPIISYPGVLLVLVMAWSFQVEMTFATWISSLYQGCAAVLGLLLLVRSTLR